MPNQVIEFTADKRFVRRARELKIIETMLRMYCRGHDHPARAPLCAECADLFDYATRRLKRCVFGDAKPTCANCVVHCYSAEMRERIRVAMRWAGPRMSLRHPVLALHHLLDGRRPAPMLPGKPQQCLMDSGPAQPGEMHSPTPLPDRQIPASNTHRGSVTQPLQSSAVTEVPVTGVQKKG